MRMVFGSDSLEINILRHKIITQVEYMSGDSHFWSGLMKIKNDLLGWTNS
jgi:hypothetical protein